MIKKLLLLFALSFFLTSLLCLFVFQQLDFNGDFFEKKIEKIDSAFSKEIIKLDSVNTFLDSIKIQDLHNSDFILPLKLDSNKKKIVSKVSKIENFQFYLPSNNKDSILEIKPFDSTLNNSSKPKEFSKKRFLRSILLFENNKCNKDLEDYIIYSNLPITRTREIRLFYNYKNTFEPQSVRGYKSNGKFPDTLSINNIDIALALDKLNQKFLLRSEYKYNCDEVKSYEFNGLPSDVYHFRVGGPIPLFHITEKDDMYELYINIGTTKFKINSIKYEKNLETTFLKLFLDNDNNSQKGFYLNLSHQYYIDFNNIVFQGNRGNSQSELNLDLEKYKLLIYSNSYFREGMVFNANSLKIENNKIVSTFLGKIKLGNIQLNNGLKDASCIQGCENILKNIREENPVYIEY